MSDPVFDAESKDCVLCGNTGVVRIIPHGGAANDAQDDECPWCLRRSIARMISPPVMQVPRSQPHAYVPNRKYPWFCGECGYAPHDTLMHIQPVVWPERKPSTWALGFCPCGVRLTKRTKAQRHCVRCVGLY